MNEIANANVNNNEKIKIIALTGKRGCGINLVYDFLLRSKYISAVSPICVDRDMSANDFLEKVIKGEIIEAYCDEFNVIWGTDISQMLSTYIYVGKFSPIQIANMAESKIIELLPIEIDMDAEARFLSLLGYPHEEGLVYKSLDEKEIEKICKEFIENNKYDIQDMEHLKYFKYHINNYKELRINLENSSFKHELREFNATHNLISNLDNFI